MPHAALTLQPGVDVIKTPTLNEAAISSSNMIRYLPDKPGTAFPQRIGGWVKYCTTALTSSIRALKSWEDLSANTWLGIGCTNGVYALLSGTNTPNNISPRTATTNNPVNISATAGSGTFTINDANSNVNNYSSVYITTPISVAGIILSGIYSVASSPSTSQYTITNATNAVYSTNQTATITNASPAVITVASAPVTGTVVTFSTTGTLPTGITAGTQYFVRNINTTTFNISLTPSGSLINTSSAGSGTHTAKFPGQLPYFTTTSGSSVVNVLLPNHGYTFGSTFTVNIPTTVGGVTLYGAYTLLATPLDANNFSFLASNTANATASAFENSDNANYVYYYAIQPPYAASAFGDNGFGANAFGGVASYGFVGTGYISGTTLTITAVSSGFVLINSIISGSTASGSASIATGTTVLSQSSGTAGGAGTYAVSVSQTIGSAGTPITITASASPGANYASTDWFLDSWGQTLVMCPPGGPIFGWIPNYYVSNAFYLQNAPTVNQGIFVAMPQQQIVAWGSSFTNISDPLLLRWSDVSNYNIWNAQSINQAGSFRIPTGSRIVSCMQGPQQGLIWTDLDLWAMQYVGAPLVYGFNKIGSNCGLIAPKAATQLNNISYWMSQKQFFMLSGNGVQVIPCPAWDVIFQNLNTNGVNNIRAAANTSFNEVWWFYPSLTQYTSVTSGTNYTIQSLGQINIAANLTASSSTINITGLSTGAIFVGQAITGQGIPANTTITAFGTGTGGTGTYTISNNATQTLTGAAIYGVANNFVALGASSNTVGITFLATASSPTLYDTGAVLSNDNDSYIKYNTVVQAWDYGTLARTAWIDQSVLGQPIASGTDNYLYQHEVGNSAAGGPINANFTTGYFSMAEGDQKVFVDQIWPDMKWGTYTGNNNATVYLTINSVNYPGDTPVSFGPYPITQGTEYLTVRVRGRLFSFTIGSTDSAGNVQTGEQFWRLGKIRYRLAPDGKF